MWISIFQKNIHQCLRIAKTSPVIEGLDDTSCWHFNTTSISPQRKMAIE